MTTTKARIQRFSDFKYFFSTETIFVVAGAAIIAALEWDVIPHSLPLFDFVTEWKILVLAIAGALIVLPPPIAKGLLHLRSRDANAKNNAELSIALKAINARTSNLVAKVREIEDGDISNTYRNHSVNECQAYFTARRTIGGNAVEHTGVHVDVIYYKLTMQAGGAKLERQFSTSNNPFTLNPTIARINPHAKKVADMISHGQLVWEKDLSERSVAIAFGIKPEDQINYAVALGVPVFRDSKSPGVVEGMLLVTSSIKETLILSDAPLVAAYAWFISVAMALDASGRSGVVSTDSQ